MPIHCSEYGYAPVDSRDPVIEAIRCLAAATKIPAANQMARQTQYLEAQVWALLAVKEALPS